MKLTKGQKVRILGPLLATEKNIKEFDAYLELLDGKLDRKRRYANHLRGVLTHHEIEFWEHLNSGVFKREGIRFRRQVAKFGYVLDFYCTSAALAIEVDGGYHNQPDQKMKDRMRDVNLAKIGIDTVRVKCSDIDDNIKPVLAHIYDEVTSRQQMFKIWGIKKPNLFIDRRALKYGFLRYMDTQRVWTAFDDNLTF